MDQILQADLLIMGEILVEIMRDREDVPLGQTGIFKGPYPAALLPSVSMLPRGSAVIPYLSEV